MRKKETGNVYWANSKLIDKSDNKARRQYAVMFDNGKNIKVSKIRGFNENIKNEFRLYELDKKKYPLTKRSGVDSYVHTYRHNPKSKLKISDKQVFDNKPVFKLSSHDTHRAILNTKSNKRHKKGRS